MTSVDNELFYEVLWDAIPYPSFVISRDNRIITANSSAETYCLSSIKQIKSKPVGNYFGGNGVILNSINQARDTQVSVTLYNVEVFWFSKSITTHDVIAAPVNNNNEKILLLFHPNGMSKKLNRSLSHRSAARSVTGMASMLAHEIRNPLAGISGAAQLLESNISTEDQELLEIIKIESQRIGGLVDKFQTFGDIRPLKQEPVNLHDILSQAKRAANAGFAKKIKIFENYDPSLPLTKGDPDLLLQVVQNLLKNAAEAVSLTSGQIIIETAFKQGISLNVGNRKKENLPLQFSIIDNGTGVPNQIKDEIFDPFVTTKFSGSGLGLSLVSKIISDHGGVVEYSRRNSRSIFSVLMPVWAKSSTKGN
ncbi:MAG: ATP-binding protein [Paracoccaceae bacterium]|nr:ATP-binding protein [Paracoccaceae bacterium]